MFRYKDTDLDPQALGRELQARLLLTGKVMQRGDRLMVQADLVDATERKQVWGERFNRPSADIFEVEDEIARQIVEKLRLKLSGDEKRRSPIDPPNDPVAYDLYLKARHHWSRRTPESIRRAIRVPGGGDCSRRRTLPGRGPAWRIRGYCSDGTARA